MEWNISMGFIWRYPHSHTNSFHSKREWEKERVKDKERNGSRPNQSTSGCVLINHFSISHGPPFHHFNYSEQSSFVLLESSDWNSTLSYFFFSPSYIFFFLITCNMYFKYTLWSIIMILHYHYLTTCMTRIINSSLIIFLHKKFE